MGNLDFDIRITDWLSLSSVNNYKYIGYNYSEYTDPRSSSGEGVDGRMREYQKLPLYVVILIISYVLTRCLVNIQ